MSKRSLNLPTVTECDGCGVCCLHMGYPAFIVGGESQPPETHWVTLPQTLKDELCDYIAHYQPPPDGELDGACCWLDPQTRLCQHHQYRPNVCRDFRVGSKGCLEWRDHYRDKIETGEKR